jgi:hypothetical protein
VPLGLVVSIFGLLIEILLCLMTSGQHPATSLGLMKPAANLQGKGYALAVQR